MPRSRGARPSIALVSNESNLLGLDYRDEARRMGPPPIPIIDAHAHVTGERASLLLLEAMDAFGVEQVWSMTPSLDEVELLREQFGARIQFIAVPEWRSTDPAHAHGRGYADRIGAFHAAGARIAKFWAAPRGIDISTAAGDAGLMSFDHPERIRAMERAADLGMCLMAHVADPDTWFKTKYADASRYGTKRAQYESFERAVDRFGAPWIAAHMGGWPEDLAFLDGLLERHANLNLDTSATKWMVREISRHDPTTVRAFFRKWSHRLIFGSDIVTSNAHLTADASAHEMDRKASSQETAFDLYASRYFALRTLWETDWRGMSPIADPDLHLVDPLRHSPRDSPPLAGVALDSAVFLAFFRENALRLLRAANPRGKPKSESELDGF